MRKIAVKSFGCSANFAEGEIIKGKFAKNGKIVDSATNADTIILNICTVKGDKKSLDEIKKIKKENPDKKIAIAGCITPSIVSKIKEIDQKIVLVNTHNILDMPKKVEKGIDALGKNKPIKLLQPRIRTNPVIGIVPVSSGCLDACAFCSTRLVKGTLYSFPLEDIIKEVEQCIADGCKEIWLTGQDTACYGFDLKTKTNLARLVSSLVEIPGDFKIRIGMGNPRHIPKFLDELAGIMKHPKVFKFIHLPVQAGSDKVLKAMRRGHNVKTVIDILTSLREEIPDITLSTDIIVGHPTETDAQFNDTMKLCQQIKFDVINIARFAARPGTPAATMPGQIQGNIKKERSRQLSYLQKHIVTQRNKNWIGWIGNIIIDSKLKEGVSGHNYAYKAVFLAEDVDLGTIVKVKVQTANNRFLNANIVQ